MKKSKTEIRKVKLSDIKTYKFRYFEEGKKKSLKSSIKKNGYDPKKYNDWITVIEWNKSFLGLNYIPFPKYSLWHGNHRMGTLRELFPSSKEIEVKVRKFPVIILYSFILFFFSMFLFLIWLVFTNVWVLVILGIISVIVNYNKAKGGKNLLEVFREKLKIRK